MSAAIDLAAGCVLVWLETDATAEAPHFEERSHLRVVASPTCAWIRFALPVEVSDWSVRGRISTEVGHNPTLDPLRTVVGSATAQGTRWVTVHLEDLSGDDHANVEIRRTWQGGFVWTPHPAAYAHLSGVPSDLRQDRRGGWVANATPDVAVVVGAPPALPPPRTMLDLSPTRVATVTLPPGDPQVALAPGGAATTEIVETYRIPAADDERFLRVAVPEHATNVAATWDGPGETIREPAAVLLRAEPSEGPIDVVVRWVENEVPAYGEGETTSFHGVRALSDGPGSWWLAAAGGVTILPDRATLVRALAYRFGMASQPEPGAPLSLRGRRPDADLVADLPTALRSRAVVPSETSADPVAPRRLARAVRSRVLTPVEAGLVATLWARQLGIDATWTLVRSARLGRGGEVGPAGHADALVRIETADGVLWLDPACTVCAPGEVRPELTGTAGFGPRGPETPPLATGDVTTHRGDGRTVWTLAGAAALDLRRELAQWPEGERVARLGERFGGAGAKILSLTGTSVAGAEMTFEVADGATPREPLGLPAPGPDGVWVDVPGTWTASRPAIDGDVDATLDALGLTYVRRVDSGRVTETLTVRERSIPQEAAAALRAARSGP